MNRKGEDGRMSVFLQTGDCYLGVMPTRVQTVLGSCVAVTMHCRTSNVGAICHAFLPESTEAPRQMLREPQPCRFVDTALDHMLSGLVKLGVNVGRLEVKVFGGASGLGGNTVTMSQYNIGKRNVDTVLFRLKDRGLRVAKQDVGGSSGRKLIFLSDTGEVWLKRLGKLTSAAAEARKAAQNTSDSRVPWRCK